MRIGPGFGLVLLLTAVVGAQPRGGGGVVNPGGNLPGTTRSLGSVVNPAQGGIRVPGTGNRGGGVNGNRVVAYPIYVGGYYYPTPYVSSQDYLSGSPAPAPAPSPTNITVVVPPQQPVTPVVINYNYGTAPPPQPDQNVDRAPAASQDDSATSEPSHYLIAFKDHTIYSATAYWVDGDTIHYFTSGNVHNQVSLSLVDRDFTQRLNKEAGLDVRLPAPSK